MPKRRSFIVPVSTSTAASIAAPANMFTPAKAAVSSQSMPTAETKASPKP